jgi:hypothetical protein
MSVIAATYNQKTRSRRGIALRAGWVARIQGPACVKERERKIATTQNQCRLLRGVESSELQKVARTIGPARTRKTANTQVRSGRASEQYEISSPSVKAFDSTLIGAVNGS